MTGLPQTVFGAGGPGGTPFVSPPGKLLNTAKLGAGIDDAGAYVTNSVKQFKFVVIEGGRRRARRELIADLKAVAAYLRRPKAKVAGSQ